jgi:hypothetical protein
MDYLTVVLNVSALLASVAAAAAAIFTFMQARSAQSTLRTQLFLSFSDRYSAPEMGVSIRKLLKWRQQHPSDFAEVWFDKYKRGERESVELEEARRTVNRFFVDIGRLYATGQIGRKFAYVLLEHYSLDVYYGICHPMWKKLYPQPYIDYVEILKKIRPSYGGLAGEDYPSSPSPDSVSIARDTEAPVAGSRV